MTWLSFLFLFFLQQHHGAQHTFEDAERWAQQFEDPARDEWQRPDEVVEASPETAPETSPETSPEASPETSPEASPETSPEEAPAKKQAAVQAQ